LKKLALRLDNSIEKREKELTQLCRELIQARGENPPGDVSDVAKVIENFLANEDIDYQRFEPSKGHVSVVATVGNRKPTLIMCGHIDVVPAGELSQWRDHPYLARVKQGKIHGRGATDMKGGVAAMLMAIAAVKDFESEISGRVIVASVPDEEAQGPGGALWLLKNKKLTGDMCLITEPTSYLDAKYNIVAGERGTLWLKITAHGKPAHGSTPMLGKNAIEMLTRFLPKLKALEKEAVKTPEDAEALIRNGQKELLRVAKKQGIPANSLTKTLTHYTVNIGVIAGGTKTNIVPEKCEAEVDTRVPAGGHPKGVEEFVRSLLPEQLEYEVINETMASYTPANWSIIKAIQKSAQRIFGYRPAATYMAATTDAHYFRELLGIPTVAFGPGHIDLAHAYNEFVLVKDVKNAARVYANMVTNITAGS